MARWVKEMLKWVEENRPHELNTFKQVLDNDSMASNAAINGIILMAHVGFEAGRQFQHENPDVPLGPIVE